VAGVCHSAPHTRSSAHHKCQSRCPAVSACVAATLTPGVGAVAPMPKVTANTARLRRLAVGIAKGRRPGGRSAGVRRRERTWSPITAALRRRGRAGSTYSVQQFGPAMDLYS